MLKDLITNLVLRILHLIGELEMMAMLYASKIIDGKKTFADVPTKLKAQVAEILIDECDLPELVPVEYGGTLED